MIEENDDSFLYVLAVRDALAGVRSASPTTRAAHQTILEDALKIAEAEEFLVRADRRVEVQRAVAARVRHNMGRLALVPELAAGVTELEQQALAAAAFLDEHQTPDHAHIAEVLRKLAAQHAALRGHLRREADLGADV